MTLSTPVLIATINLTNQTHITILWGREENDKADTRATGIEGGHSDKLAGRKPKAANLPAGRKGSSLRPDY